MELRTRFLLRVSVDFVQVHVHSIFNARIGYLELHAQFFCINLKKKKSVVILQKVESREETLCLILVPSTSSHCESKTQFRGSGWRRQVANYSLAMTQWQPNLEQFAAVDLRSSLFWKVGVESKIISMIPCMYVQCT